MRKSSLLARSELGANGMLVASLREFVSHFVITLALLRNTL